MFNLAPLKQLTQEELNMKALSVLFATAALTLTAVWLKPMFVRTKFPGCSRRVKSPLLRR